MRVSQINAVYGYGSTGTIVKDLQDLCLWSGIDCEVVYSQTNLQNCANTYHIGNIFSNKLHALFSRVAGKQGYYSVLSTLRLILHYHNNHPDIIHLHNLHGCYINVPLLLKYAAKKGIAVVVTLHDCWFFTGGCTHYTHSNCTKWRESCGNCPQRFEEFPALLYDTSSAQLRAREELFGNIHKLYAVGVSKWIADEASVRVFSKAHCLTIHNGIDTEFFQPTESSFRTEYNLEDKFIILAPANKWFLDINRRTFDFFASHLYDNMCMVFIGTGVDKRRLSDKMIDLGFVSSREELRAIYSSVDVMVNCTREESLSLLNVEVQSCGTPVVTYSNTGVKETVDGICGFAVENGAPEAAWEAMMCIKRKGKNEYSEQCREWIRSEFNNEINYMRYIDLYRSIVEDSQ